VLGCKSRLWNGFQPPHEENIESDAFLALLTVQKALDGGWTVQPAVVEGSAAALVGRSHKEDSA